MGYREIGYGEGDMEIVRELAEKIRKGKKQRELWNTEPPVAESVYVCRWCFRIVERSELNWVDDNGQHVCDGCAGEHFTA